MREKKVIVVIVEGPSDENAIGGILKEFFSSEEVQFTVVHGDITSDESTTVANVITKIDKLINDVKIKYGYRRNDFIKVIHLTDMDGAFTNDCIRNADVEKIHYYEDHIEGRNIQAIDRRNKHKSEILCKLYSTGKVHNIGYRIYFNSCNLEHVLYGVLKDFNDEEKTLLSDDFADKYEGKVDDFIKFISDETLAVPGTYKATWKYIENGKHSLERHSNMHLIFEK